MNNRRLTKGALFRIYNDEVVDRLDFQFNPTRLSRRLGAVHAISDGPGEWLPSASLSRFDRAPVDFDLLFWGREGEVDAQEMSARLELFVSPGPDYGPDATEFISSGHAKLVFGPRTWTGVVTEVSLMDERFNRDLKVLEVRATISLLPTSQGARSDLVKINRLRTQAKLSG